MSGDHDTYILPQICPYCGKENDAASNAVGPEGPPEPGNFAMCIQCGEFSILADDLKLRKVTDDEAVELWSDPEIRMLRASWLQVMRETRQ